MRPEPIALGPQRASLSFQKAFALLNIRQSSPRRKRKLCRFGQQKSGPSSSFVCFWLLNKGITLGVDSSVRASSTALSATSREKAMRLSLRFFGKFPNRGMTMNQVKLLIVTAVLALGGVTASQAETVDMSKFT